MTREDRTREALRIVIGPLPRDLMPATSLRDDLGLDDLDIVELVVELEQAFGVAVTEEEGDALETWGDVLKLLNKLLAEPRHVAPQPTRTAAVVTVPN